MEHNSQRESHKFPGGVCVGLGGEGVRGALLSLKVRSRQQTHSDTWEPNDDLKV